MKFVQAKNYYKGGNDPSLIVIHVMVYPEKTTAAEWCADYFAGKMGTAPKASAHYCLDNDSAVQCLNHEDGGWHTPGSLPGLGEINRRSIGIEHAGLARQTRKEWLDDYSLALIEISAALVAQLCLDYSIPAVRLTSADLKAGKVRGITGHVDCTEATGKGDHWDPGPGFPWDVYMDRVQGFLAELEGAPQDDNWVRVAGRLVSPIYVPFVGIGQAKSLAERLGCELPTPELVDAIWEAADMKVNAREMVRTDHDGSMAGMMRTELLESQGERLENFIGDASLGADWTLLAGAFKDVCQKDGKVGIYGWHDLYGKPIQPFFAGHSAGWTDYSQGLRLVKKEK